MFEVASSKFSGIQQLTKLHTDYMYSFSHHPTCVVTAITKNLCKRQAAVDKELARSQQLSLKDIPQGGGPSTASMVEPY